MESRRTAAVDISTLLPGQSCCFLMLPSKKEKCLEWEEREYSGFVIRRDTVEIVRALLCAGFFTPAGRLLLECCEAQKYAKKLWL